jgi:hypothetical protein
LYLRKWSRPLRLPWQCQRPWTLLGAVAVAWPCDLVTLWWPGILWIKGMFPRLFQLMIVPQDRASFIPHGGSPTTAPAATTTLALRVPAQWLRGRKLVGEVDSRHVPVISISINDSSPTTAPPPTAPPWLRNQPSRLCNCSSMDG